MTAFDDRLREAIALDGPIPVWRYMELANSHYYATRDPFGRAGDFTTAPEISQMFGELLGVWVMEVWHAMGRPSLTLVELGPGRGTLMADLLRAGKALPGFHDTIRVVLVETSPSLRALQEAALACAPVTVDWITDIRHLPDGPLIVVANEFFDALPISQYVATDGGWCERQVGLAGERLVFGLAPPSRSGAEAAARPGTVREVHVAAAAIMQDLCRRIGRDGGAALIADYGDWGRGIGDTLQAVRQHAFVDPLLDPGESDLTAQVDFAQLAEPALAAELSIHGPGTQAAFLEALGLTSRAARLKARASPAQAGTIDSAVARLTEAGPRGMGELFKVMAVTHPDLADVPGLSRQMLTDE